MFQLTLFEPTYADQYTQEGFNFLAPRVGDVTFLNGLQEPVHRWFRLTPSYSPELVRFLFNEFACDKQMLICDPFLGKGTTTIEAKKAGLRAIGVEINPLLKLASEYALFWEVDIQEFVKQGRKIETQFLSLLKETQLLPIETVLEQFQLNLPPIHNVFRWWQKEVLKELLLLKSILSETSNQNYKQLFWLALCASALDCANVHRNHPTISFDDNHQRNINVWQDFQDNLNILTKDLQHLPNRENWGDVSIISGDSTQLSKHVRKPIDRVITSPPYPNRFSYVHTTRPQLFFMDIFSNPSESAELDCAAIGGTWGKATSMLYEGQLNPNNQIVDILSPLIAELRPKNNLMCNYAVKYFNMMADHIQELRQVASERFRGAYVVGNSRLSDVEIFTDILLAKIFERYGFKVDKILVLRKRGGKKKLYETVVCVYKA